MTDVARRPRMDGRYGRLNYRRLTKRGMLLGAGLFMCGLVGEIAVHVVDLGVPGWGDTLLFDAELVGVAVLLLTPFVFGIFLPLTE